jgi:DNA end-binding protein Ku
MNKEDFEKASGEKSNTIEILYFCDADSIDSIYYDTPYYIRAQESGDKAYFLLYKALEKTNTVALVNYKLRNKNHIAVIKKYKNNILILNNLRFESNIIKVEKAEKKIHVTAQELSVAEKIIEQLKSPFEPHLLHDNYVESLEQIIAKRAGKSKILVSEEKIAEVYDMMALLKASLKNKSKKKSAA